MFFPHLNPFCPVTGGHAVGDKSTGPAKGRGETAGKTARERQCGRTSKKQVFTSEGRRRKGILFLFQRQMTEYLSFYLLP